MRVFSLFIFYSNPLLSFQDHARQCGRVVFTDVFSSGSGKYVRLHSLLHDHCIPCRAGPKISNANVSFRKGVIEYNSREEMEDAIRKLDNTRVGDRGENMIRVYKVCATASAIFVARVDLALSGGCFRACCMMGAPLAQRNRGVFRWCDVLLLSTFLSNAFSGGRSAWIPPSPWTFPFPPRWSRQIRLPSWWPRWRPLEVATPPPYSFTPVRATIGLSLALLTAFAAGAPAPGISSSGCALCSRLHFNSHVAINKCNNSSFSVTCRFF
jgi:hypothetical protein